MLNLQRKQNWAVLKVKKTPVFQLTDLQKQINKEKEKMAKNESWKNKAAKKKIAQSKDMLVFFAASNVGKSNDQKIKIWT